MTDQIITCPNCGTQIPITDALTEKIKGQLRTELESSVKEKEKRLAEKERLLLENQKNMEAEVGKRLETEKVKIWTIAKVEAGKKWEIEMQDLKKANEEKETQLASMRKQELELRQRSRELETKEKNMELELTRKTDEIVQRISTQAKKEAEDAARMKLLEKEKQLEQLKKSLEEANRRAEQGSMQIQGDAQETDLKLALKTGFPADTIEDIATGIRGADLVQTVYSSLGQAQGVILWESKNTKSWNSEWIKKLKDDQISAKADIVIIATQALPEEIDSFGIKDGVWITGYKYALPLVAALRTQLFETNRIRQSFVGKDAKMEILYNYLGGPEFKNRIETIVLAFMSLKEGLDAEKRAMEKIWNRREKEIERIMKNTTGFYGDLEGIMGASLPAISALELPAENHDRLF